MGTEGDAGAMRATSDYDGITLHEWMWSAEGLALPTSSAELLVYAKVYSVSHHNAGALTASQPKLAELFGLTRECVNRTLARLVDKGLVYVCGTCRAPGQGGRPVNVYAVCQAPIDRAVGAARSSREENQFSPATNVTEGHVPAPSVTDASRTDVTAPSRSNVTGQANVTEAPPSRKAAPSCGNADLSTGPLTPSPRTRTTGDEEERPRDLTETEFLAFRTLLKRSLKPVAARYEQEALDDFRKLVSGDFDAEMVLAAYDSYERTLRRNAAEGRPYNPMSLTHFLSRRKPRPGEDEGRYNAWLEDALEERERQERLVEGTRVKTDFRRTSDGDWVVIATGRPAEYVRGVRRGASLEEAIRAYGSYEHE
ncbi:MAG: hypothetical protein LKE37_01155 [Atopobiaceae bacterium]|jgi:hypothetical protein|nr:hypothetical protein [Atopobiaceae bacterium]